MWKRYSAGILLLGTVGAGAILFLWFVFLTIPSVSSTAAAAGTAGANDFGGWVLTPPIPCKNGGVFVTVRQSGLKVPPVIPVIWTPATITRLQGPPTRVGQSIVGKTDIPFVCLTNTLPPFPLPGMRIFMMGSSL